MYMRHLQVSPSFQMAIPDCRVGNVVGKGNRHLFLMFLWVCHWYPLECCPAAQQTSHASCLHACADRLFLTTKRQHLQVETAAMTTGLVVACFRLHAFYNSSEQSLVGPGMIITFIVLDAFMFVSVLALAVTQASQVNLLVLHATALSESHTILKPYLISRATCLLVSTHRLLTPLRLTKM